MEKRINNCKCNQCGIEFYKKPSKVGKVFNFCQKECMKLFREEEKKKHFSVIERECPKCTKMFFPVYKKQVCCSQQCASIDRAAKKTALGTYKTTCGWCKKEFVRINSNRSKHNDFCSSKCSEAYIRGSEHMYIKKNCIRCGIEFECLYRRQTKHCSKKCASPYQEGKEHIGYGKEGPRKGMKSWTHGLTKETDVRIAELGKKVSIVHKEQFSNGIRSNKGTNNPNYGKTVADRTLEQLENYSKGAWKRFNSIDGSSGFVKGKYFSIKNNKEIKYRSSYELLVMRAFDQDQAIKFYEYEPFSIKYTKVNRYYPDFIVYYHNNTSKLIEIKGWIEDEEKYTLKVDAAKQYCTQRNIIYEVWFQSDVDQYCKSIINETTKIKNVFI